MFKKLILAGMAIAAFAAFAVAPAASASPVLTEKGVAVAANSLVTFTSTETPTFTGAFNVTCTKGTITAKVTKNSGTKIEGTALAANVQYSGTGTGGDCTSALGSTRVIVNSELCLTSEASDTFVINGCEAKPVEFTLEVTGTGPCKYSTSAIKGTFTTNATPATVKVTEQEAKKIEGGFFCPSSGKLDQDFDLYTDNAEEAGLTIS
jgi:hypothetical protein